MSREFRALRDRCFTNEAKRRKAFVDSIGSIDPVRHMAYVLMNV
jgi:hypothetical protein